MNPNASRLGQWWGKKSLDVQADALNRLDDLAPRFVYQDGKLVIEHVEPMARGLRDISSSDLRIFLDSYVRGSWRLGTPFNDIRPWNMGKNGKIFDPAYHPLQEMALPVAGELGLTVIRVGDQYLYVYPKKEAQMRQPLLFPQRR